MSKFCTNCGNKLEEWNKFCTKCGNNNKSFIPCVRSIHFHIAGITKHEKELKILINKLLEDGYLEKYQGLSRSEIIDYGDLSIYEDQLLEGIRIEEDEFEGKKALKVLVKDSDDNFVFLGYVPKNKIKEVEDFLLDERLNDKHYKMDTEYQIVGGKRKNVLCDYDGKCSIEEIELNYGVEVDISIMIK